MTEVNMAEYGSYRKQREVLVDKSHRNSSAKPFSLADVVAVVWERHKSGLSCSNDG